MSNSIGKDAVNITFSKIITMGISMVSAMLLSRFRSLEEYGTYSQLLMTIQLVTTIFMLGLPNSINYFLARAENQEERRKFLSVYYTLSTFLSFVAGLSLILSVPIISAYFKNSMIKSFTYFLAVYPWTQITIHSVTNVFIVYKKTVRLMYFNIITSVLLLFSIFIVQILNMSFREYMIIYTLCNVCFSLYIYISVNRLAKGINFKIDRRLINNIFTFSLPIGLASVVGTINIELDKLMIGGLLPTEKMAVYANAAKELPVTFITSSVTAVLIPTVVRLLKLGENEKAIDLWKHSVYITYAIVAILAIGCFTFAEDAITLLYSDKYIEGKWVFAIYSLNMLLRCTYFGLILNSTGNTKFILQSSCISLTVNIVLNFLLYKVFGFIGPALATLISAVIMNFSQLLMSAKKINLKFKNIFPWKDILNLTLINVVLALFAILLKQLMCLDAYVGSILETLVIAAIWGIVYTIIILKKIKFHWNMLNNN